MRNVVVRKMDGADVKHKHLPLEHAAPLANVPAEHVSDLIWGVIHSSSAIYENLKSIMPLASE